MLKKKVILLLLALALLWSCEKKDQNADEIQQIAVFVPGMLEGSPTYEMMDQGVRRAAEERNVTVQSIEGGFNQGEWKDKLMTLAAEGSYSLIVTSNPAMPEICREVGESYPQQIFLCLDGSDLAADNLISLVYNHMEQAFMAGHLAGLITQSDMDGANEDLKVGLIAGQLYPDMERAIIPGFEMGIKTVNPQADLDFRVLGNWYDAAKAAELAQSMFDNGVDVILPIAGGANQGVISAAKEADKYLIWFDSPGTDIEPGVILGSSIVAQEELAYELTGQFLDGDLQGDTVLKGGVEEGYVLFDQEDSQYERHVPQDIRDAQAQLVERMSRGELSLDNAR